MTRTLGANSSFYEPSTQTSKERPSNSFKSSATLADCLCSNRSIVTGSSQAFLAIQLLSSAYLAASRRL